ncbi:MAG: ATP-binding protein, partial [Acidimicrobiia bacterium]|nr:ATP-binding protein [Acidimicrobiia bacterium]
AETYAADTEFRLVGEPTALPVLHELTLLRVAQGALANAGAHANASTIRVTLTYLPDRTTLDVVDDGVGFDPAVTVAPTDESGFGLSVMRHRLDEVDGTLTIETSPGDGTAVVASIPWGEP